MDSDKYCREFRDIARFYHQHLRSDWSDNTNLVRIGLVTTITFVSVKWESVAVRDCYLERIALWWSLGSTYGFFKSRLASREPVDASYHPRSRNSNDAFCDIRGDVVSTQGGTYIPRVMVESGCIRRVHHFGARCRCRC